MCFKYLDILYLTPKEHIGVLDLTISRDTSLSTTC